MKRLLDFALLREGADVKGVSFRECQDQGSNTQSGQHSSWIVRGDRLEVRRVRAGDRVQPRILERFLQEMERDREEDRTH